MALDKLICGIFLPNIYDTNMSYVQSPLKQSSYVCYSKHTPG